MKEKEFISNLIHSPKRISDVIEFLSPKHFEDERLGVIYKAMINLYADNKEFDIIILSKESGVEQEFVIDLYKNDIPVKVIETARSIYEQFLEREYDRILAKHEDGDIFDRIGSKGEKILSLLRDFERIQSDTNLYDDIDRIIENSKDCLITKETLKSFSFPTLNKIMNGGALLGNLITVSGREKDGKTSFGLRLIADYAFLKFPVAIFSYEMGRDEVAWKLLSYEGNIHYDNFRNPKENPYYDWENLSKALRKRFFNTKIYINDEIYNDIELRSKIKALKLKYNIKAVLVDYIGLIPCAKKHDTRELQVAAISRSLKQLAKELGLVIIILSQRNRGDDIAESLALQRDSDFAIALKYPHLYGETMINFREEQIYFKENEFFVRLTHSRHSIPAKYFKAFYNSDGNFVELDEERELF